MIAHTRASPRIRFNWGFWDASNDKLRGFEPRWAAEIKPHCDQDYGNGYKAGFASSSSPRPTSSEPAWQLHIATTGSEFSR